MKNSILFSVNNKFILLCCFSVLLFVNKPIYGQLKKAQIQLGGDSLEVCNWMTQTSDGGYVMSGWSNSFGAGNGDMYIVKLDSNARILWTTTIGGKQNDGGSNIIQTTDGGYASIGWSHSFGTGRSIISSLGLNIYVVRLNSSGNVVWTKTYADSNWFSDGASIIQTKDNGFDILGRIIKSLLGDTSEITLMKIDSSGNIKWTTNIWGESDNGAGFTMAQTSDGGIVFTGWTNSFGAGGYDVFVAKLDSAGNVKWTRTIGGKGDDLGYAIIQTKDSGFAISGETTSYGDTLFGDVYVIKLDKSGTIQWTKTVGGTYEDFGESIVQSSDGGYTITGETHSYGNAGKGDVYILKLDSSGNLEWTRTIGGMGEDRGQTIMQTKDGGYAIGGFWNFTTVGKAYFIKIDSLGYTCNGTDSGGIVSSGGTITSIDSGRIKHGGRITSSDSGFVSSGGRYIGGCGTTNSINDLSVKENTVEVYPNPASVYVIFNMSSASGSFIKIFDITGREVETLPTINNQANINVIAFSPGIYFYEIVGATYIIDRGKFSVIK